MFFIHSYVHLEFDYSRDVEQTFKHFSFIVSDSLFGIYDDNGFEGASTIVKVF
jgi:hypothetical protein